jgi:hypothetical protein
MNMQSPVDQEVVNELLKRLHSGDEDAFHSLLELESDIHPSLTQAFNSAHSATEKARILEVAWQRREHSCLPLVKIALGDPDKAVWKEALNGLVALASQDALQTLLAARASASAELQEWIDDAADQIRSAPGFRST